MTDIERLEDRLAAVERTVVDGTFDVDGMEDPGELAEQVEALESRIQELEERLAEVEGTVQSMGGFVGRIQSVNEGVEQRADAAIAAVDRIETRLDELDRTLEQHDIEVGPAVPREAGESARTPDAAASSDDRTVDDEQGARQGDRDGADLPERRIDDVVSGTEAEAPLLGEAADGASSDGDGTAGSSNGKATTDSSHAGATTGSANGETTAESAGEEETSVASDGGGRRFVASQDDVDDRVANDDAAPERSEAATDPGDDESGLLDAIRSKFQ